MIKLQFDADPAQIPDKSQKQAAFAASDNSVRDGEGILLRRVCAYLIDIALLGLLGIAAIPVMGILGLMSFGLLWIGVAPLLLILILGYDTLCCAGQRQATAGMRLMGLRMQSKSSQNITLGQAFMQSAGFYVSIALTSFLILGIALLNAERRCLHDFVSGTTFTRLT